MNTIKFYCIIVFILFGFIFLQCSNSTAPEIDRPVFPNIDIYPSWSPDGGNIIYYHLGIINIYPDGSYTMDRDSLGLWKVEADGSNPELLINDAIKWPKWSNGGDWIAFEYNANLYRIHYINNTIDSTQIHKLTTDYVNRRPTWNSNDSLIYYDTNANDPLTLLYSIWKMGRDGSNRQLVIERAQHPNISPDNNTILFIRYVEVDNSKYPEVFSLDIQSTNTLQLTDIQQFCVNPKFSPDGTKICFNNYGQIMVMNSDGSDLSNVTNGGGFSWAPDSNRLVFVGMKGVLWIIDLSDLSLIQLTRGPTIDS